MEDSEEEGDDAMREDNVVRLHKIGKDNLTRLNEEEENLMRPEVDVMSRLFQWDFDQLLRQDVKLEKIIEQSTILATTTLIPISQNREGGMSAGIEHCISWLAR